MKNSNKKISTNEETKFYEFNACGYTVRIKSLDIKEQDFELLDKENKVMGIIKENISRSYDGSVYTSYSVGDDIFDSLKDAVETIVYNLELECKAQFRFKL